MSKSKTDAVVKKVPRLRFPGFEGERFAFRHGVTLGRPWDMSLIQCEGSGISVREKIKFQGAKRL